jgi:arginine exporter protein ArgO
MKNIIWKVFLTGYLIALSFHISNAGFESTWSISILLGGFLLALVAHKWSSVLSILFLLVHMVLEAIEYSTHPLVGILAFWFFFHVILDFAFLYGETSKHFAKAKIPLFLSGLVAISSIYLFLPRYINHSSSHTNGEPLMVYFVLGGIVGCVLSHLLPHTHKHKKIHQ